MDFGDTNAVRVKDRHPELANGVGGKSNSSGNVSEERQRRRLPQSLVIDGDGEAPFAGSSDDFAQRAVRTSVYFPDVRCQFAAVDKLFPARMGKPNDFSVRKRFAQTGAGGQSVNDICGGAKTHNLEARVRH